MAHIFQGIKAPKRKDSRRLRSNCLGLRVWVGCAAVGGHGIYGFWGLCV